MTERMLAALTRARTAGRRPQSRTVPGELRWRSPVQTDSPAREVPLVDGGGGARIHRGPLPVAEAVALAQQIALGLEAAHGRGIVHRDIKPANVIVTLDGVAKIVDLGVAKLTGHDLTEPGATPGTVAYMSPEQTRGRAIDVRTDLWSLGVLLYEMLTGDRPFRGDSSDAVIFAIRHDQPERLTQLRPDVSAPLARAVHRCLEKDPHPPPNASVQRPRAAPSAATSC